MIKEIKRKLIKLWHISDTHGYHDLLIVPKGIDWVIHSGSTETAEVQGEE